MRTHISFNLREFLQHVDPQLLIRYIERFHEEYQQKEGHPSATIDGILAEAKGEGVTLQHLRDLVALSRTTGPLARLLEGPLKCVNDLQCPRGRACLQRELAADDIEIDPETDPVNAGMKLLLDYPERMSRLLAIYQVEQTEDWRMFTGPEPMDVKVTQTSAEAIGAEFSKALQQQGLSGQCRAYVYRQQERVIIEVAHEQYTEALREFRGGEIEIDWRKPVRHARLVYRPSTGLLKVKVYRNDGQLIDHLRRSVGRHLFGQEGRFFQDDAEARFDLSSLAEKPDWQTDPADEISDVRVVALDFEWVGSNGATAQFRATRTDELHEMLRAYSAAASGVHIHGAGIRFKFPGERNTGQRTIYLKAPDSSNLGDDDYDRVIEKYLSRWGLLNAPEPPETDLEPDRKAREAARRMAPPGSLFARSI